MGGQRHFMGGAKPPVPPAAAGHASDTSRALLILGITLDIGISRMILLTKALESVINIQTNKQGDFRW